MDLSPPELSTQSRLGFQWLPSNPRFFFRNNLIFEAFFSRQIAEIGCLFPKIPHHPIPPPKFQHLGQQHSGICGTIVECGNSPQIQLQSDLPAAPFLDVFQSFSRFSSGKMEQWNPVLGFSTQPWDQPLGH